MDSRLAVFRRGRSRAGARHRTENVWRLSWLACTRRLHARRRPSFNRGHGLPQVPRLRRHGSVGTQPAMQAVGNTPAVAVLVAELNNDPALGAAREAARYSEYAGRNESAWWHRRTGWPPIAQGQTVQDFISPVEARPTGRPTWSSRPVNYPALACPDVRLVSNRRNERSTDWFPIARSTATETIAPTVRARGMSSSSAPNMPP